MDFDGDRLTLHSDRERLLPHDDVAALDLAGRRVVERHAAGQVEAEGDELVAVPADAADVAAGGGADRLLVDEHVVLLIERVARPGKRRHLAQLADVVDLHPDVHVAATLPA